jgi:hypothetical protein
LADPRLLVRAACCEVLLQVLSTSICSPFWV